MIKKVVSILLAVAMIAALCIGCGGSGDSFSDSGSSSGTTGETDTGSDSTDTGSTDASGGDFTVTTVRWADWGEAYHEGFIDDAASEAGINVNWDTQVIADWADRKAVLMASGNLPDAFLGSICFTEAEIASNQDSFIALDEYIADNMPNLTAIMDKDPQMKALATSADGHIYGLPSKRPMRPLISNQMFINQDWLTELNLDMPDTYDDFIDVLTAFQGKDSGIIPYGQGYVDSTMYFMLPFGVTLGADNTYFMTIKDDAPAFLPTYDGYKEGLKAMNEAFTAGLIEPELYTMDTSMRDAKLMQEPPVVGSAAGWTPDATFGPSASQYAPLPALAGPDGERYVTSDPQHWNFSRYEFMITSSCEDPAALLRWMDLFYTDDASIQTFYGSFGVGTEKDGDNYNILPPQDGNSADTWAWINSLRDFGPKYVEDGFNDRVNAPTDSGDGLKLAIAEPLAQYAKPAFPNVSYTSDELSFLATNFLDLGTYVTTMQAQFVTQGGVDEGWDAYINTLNQMGLERFMDIQNEAYQRYQTSIGQ